MRVGDLREAAGEAIEERKIRAQAEKVSMIREKGKGSPATRYLRYMPFMIAVNGQCEASLTAPKPTRRDSFKLHVA